MSEIETLGGRDAIASDATYSEYAGEVPDFTTVHVRGGGAKAIVTRVGRGATLIVEGGGALVMVAGDVETGAEVRVRGGAAMAVVAGDVAVGARVEADGSGAIVVVRGRTHGFATATGGRTRTLTEDSA